VTLKDSPMACSAWVTAANNSEVKEFKKAEARANLQSRSLTEGARWMHWVP